MRHFLPALLLATIALTACGTASTPPTASPRTTTTTARPNPSVGWARQFCGLDSQLTTNAPPAPLQSVGTPTDADRQNLLEYLQQAKSLLTAAKQAFAALSPAPTADTNAMLTGYRQNIDEALTNVDGDIASTSQASGDNLAMDFTLDPAAMTLLQSGELSVVSSAVKAHPEIRLLFTGMPGCSVYTTGG